MTEQIESPWLTAVEAALDKKAQTIKVLDLRGVSTMTDHFVICSGTNPRQIQAICDEIHQRMKQERGELPLNVEGFTHAEWILMDYGDCLIHIFSEKARAYYDLERLWRQAKIVPLPEYPEAAGIAETASQ